MGNDTDDIFLKNSMKNLESKNSSTDGIFLKDKSSSSRIVKSEYSRKSYNRKTRVVHEGYIPKSILESEENTKKKD